LQQVLTSSFFFSFSFFFVVEWWERRKRRINEEKIMEKKNQRRMCCIYYLWWNSSAWWKGQKDVGEKTRMKWRKLKRKWAKKKGLGTSIISGEAPLFGGVRKEEMKDRKKSKGGKKSLETYLQKGSSIHLIDLI